MRFLLQWHGVEIKHCKGLCFFKDHKIFLTLILDGSQLWQLSKINSFRDAVLSIFFQDFLRAHLMMSNWKYKVPITEK